MTIPNVYCRYHKLAKSTQTFNGGDNLLMKNYLVTKMGRYNKCHTSIHTHTHTLHTQLDSG